MCRSSGDGIGVAVGAGVGAGVGVGTAVGETVGIAWAVGSDCTVGVGSTTSAGGDNDTVGRPGAATNASVGVGELVAIVGAAGTTVGVALIRASAALIVACKSAVGAAVGRPSDPPPTTKHASETNTRAAQAANRVTRVIPCCPDGVRLLGVRMRRDEPRRPLGVHLRRAHFHPGLFFLEPHGAAAVGLTPATVHGLQRDLLRQR